MTTIIIFEDTGHSLIERDRVQVADSVPDKETAGWAAWTRGAARPKGNYALVVAGKRFSVTQQTTTTTTPLGAM